MSETVEDVPKLGTDGEPPPGVFGELSLMFMSGRAAISQFVDLLTLEARRACLTLMWMGVFAIVASICIVTAWMGVMAALIIWAMALGASALFAVFAAAVLNAAAAFVLIQVCIRKSHDLRFAATRRRLAGVDPLKAGLP